MGRGFGSSALSAGCGLADGDDSASDAVSGDVVVVFGPGVGVFADGGDASGGPGEGDATRLVASCCCAAGVSAAADDEGGCVSDQGNPSSAIIGNRHGVGAWTGGW